MAGIRRYNIIDEEDLKAAVATMDRARGSAAMRQGIDQKG